MDRVVVIDKKNLASIRILTLIAIMSFGLLLRLPYLELYPSQIHVDELSNIYDGYSLSETGADRSGQTWPTIIRGFGESDNRPPLYVWLASLSIKVLGYSIFAGRLPSVIFGLLSLILLFQTAKKIGGELFGYVSLLLGVISPWHITFSRIALESAVLPGFFIILTIYLFVLLNESFSTKHLIKLAFCIGFATNDYQSTKLVFFVISILVFIYLLVKVPRNVKLLATFVFFTGLGAAPQLYTMIAMSDQFFSRASNTVMPFQFDTAYIYQVLLNFYKNLSPNFLFLDTGIYNNLTVARLLSLEMSFFYIGMFTCYKRLRMYGKFHPLFLYVIVVLCILPSALTYDNPHALRSSGNIIVFPMITSAGILSLCQLIRDTTTRRVILISVVTLLLVQITLLLRAYLSNTEMSSVGQQNLLVELGKKIAKYQQAYDNVYIESIGNQPYIYVIHYSDTRPYVFQKMKKVNIGNGWDNYQSIGKFHFLPSDSVIKKMAESHEKCLGVITVKSFIENCFLIDSISVHDETLYFYSKHVNAGHSNNVMRK